MPPPPKKYKNKKLGERKLTRIFVQNGMKHPEMQSGKIFLALKRKLGESNSKKTWRTKMLHRKAAESNECVVCFSPEKFAI